MSNHGINQALDLVKDAAKFKVKLEQLAKTEASANDAMGKAKAMMGDAQRQVDAARAEAKTIVDDAVLRSGAQMKSVEQAMQSAKKREAEAVSKINLAEKAEVKAAEAESIVVRREAEVSIKEKDFAARVKAFNETVKSICERA